MATSSEHWDEMTFFFTSPNLGSLIRNAPVICNYWPPPPPNPNTHTYGDGRGIAGLMCETLAFLRSRASNIMHIYIPLNLLL